MERSDKQKQGSSSTADSAAAGQWLGTLTDYECLTVIVGDFDEVIKICQFFRLLEIHQYSLGQSAKFSACQSFPLLL